MLLGNLGSAEAVERALDQVAQDAQDILAVAQSVAAEYEAGEAPFQEHVHVRALVFDYLATHATGMLGWAERSRQALGEWPELGEEERAERALARIAARAQTLPPG